MLTSDVQVGKDNHLNSSTKLMIE